MLNNLKSTAKNSFIYSIGNISTKLAGFILIPLYTSYLSVADFGVLTVLEISTQLLVTVISIKLPYALMRFYWDKNYQHRQKSVFFTIFLFLVIISALIVLSLDIFSNQISIFFFTSDSYSRVLSLMFFAAGLQTIFNLFVTKLRIEERSFYFSLINIMRLIITLILTIYLIVYSGKGIDGIYIAQIIGIVISFMGLFRYAIVGFEYKIEFDALKEMIIYGYPLILAEISGVIFAITSRYVLNFMTSLGDVAIFSLGYKIANTINVFILSSAMLAITPTIYKKINAPDNNRYYAKLMTYLGFGLMIFILWVSLFSTEIVKLLARNKEYWDASQIVPILAFSAIFNMLKDISQTGLHITKKTKIIAVNISVMAILNIGLSIVLIPIFKSTGAAIAGLVAQIFFFFLIYHSAQKEYPIPYELGKIAKLVALGIFLFGIGQLANDLHLLLRIIIKHTLVLIFPIILYYWNFYDKDELEQLKRWFQETRRYFLKNNRSTIK